MSLGMMQIIQYGILAAKQYPQTIKMTKNDFNRLKEECEKYNFITAKIENMKYRGMKIVIDNRLSEPVFLEE